MPIHVPRLARAALLILVPLLTAITCTEKTSSEGCTKDSQCKDARVCKDGTCVDPAGSTASTASATAHEGAAKQKPSADNQRKPAKSSDGTSKRTEEQRRDAIARAKAAEAREKAADAAEQAAEKRVEAAEAREEAAAAKEKKADAKTKLALAKEKETAERDREVALKERQVAAKERHASAREKALAERENDDPPVKAPAPDIFKLAPDGLPTFIPLPSSPVPTVNDWGEDSHPIKIKNGDPFACKGKMLREWLQVNCYQHGKATPRYVKRARDGGTAAQFYPWTENPKYMQALTQVIPNATTRVVFFWKNQGVTEQAYLIVAWPKGAPRPSVSMKR